MRSWLGRVLKAIGKRLLKEAVEEIGNKAREEADKRRGAREFLGR